MQCAFFTHFAFFYGHFCFLLATHCSIALHHRLVDRLCFKVVELMTGSPCLHAVGVSGYLGVRPSCREGICVCAPWGFLVIFLGLPGGSRETYPIHK
jgi:hypothetical protein